jgi:hypothetical protein
MAPSSYEELEHEPRVRVEEHGDPGDVIWRADGLLRARRNEGLVAHRPRIRQVDW